MSSDPEFKSQFSKQFKTSRCLKDYVHEEKIYGLSTNRDPDRPDFVRFKGKYLLVEDATGIHKPIIIQEYDMPYPPNTAEGKSYLNRPPWPKIYFESNYKKGSVFLPPVEGDHTSSSDLSQQDGNDGAGHAKIIHQNQHQHGKNHDNLMQVEENQLVKGQSGVYLNNGGGGDENTNPHQISPGDHLLNPSHDTRIANDPLISQKLQPLNEINPVAPCPQHTHKTFYQQQSHQRGNTVASMNSNASGLNNTTSMMPKETHEQRNQIKIQAMSKRSIHPHYGHVNEHEDGINVNDNLNHQGGCGKAFMPPPPAPLSKTAHHNNTVTHESAPPLQQKQEQQHQQQQKQMHGHQNMMQMDQPHQKGKLHGKDFYFRPGFCENCMEKYDEFYKVRWNTIATINNVPIYLLFQCFFVAC